MALLISSTQMQPVAELRAALDVGGPVAGVHVADRHQIGRTGEGEQPSPPPAGGDRYRAWTSSSDRLLCQPSDGVDMGIPRVRRLPFAAEL